MVATGNGQQAPPDRESMHARLTGEPLTQGYKPTLPLWALWASETVPQFYLLRDIELMLIHPIVLNALNYFKSGISGAEFEVECEAPEISMFIEDQCLRFWDRGVPLLQGGYEYGWIGCENVFAGEAPMEWAGLIQFSPRDVFLLTQNAKPIGVRVKQITGKTDGGHDQPLNQDMEKQPAHGQKDLWFASGSVPAKGLWYAHNPRYNQFYGQSQLLGAWRPWRRLAWKDGAETVVDGGFYRHGYAGPVVKYPEEDFQANIGDPGTTLDSQGRPRRFARDMARQMAEWYKAGAGVGLPSTMYPPDMGGGPKWEFDLPKSTLAADGLLAYVKYLCDQIYCGIGVPTELLAASESGSGYSGRAIPMEGFMMGQQKLANDLLNLFMVQVLRPLVLWNFGPVQWTAKVANLLQSRRKAQLGDMGEGKMQPGQQAPTQVGTRPEGTQPPIPEQMKPGQPFSLDSRLVTDKIREIARRTLEKARAA